MEQQTILVTGCNGQLGMELQEISGNFPQYNFLFTDIQELDIANKTAVEKIFSANKINALINCAAYTAVDKAESDAEAAMKLNKDAVSILAGACKNHNALLIHISTDYIFGGKAWLPYAEDHPANPESVYGKSKYEGEQEIIKSGTNSLIIRISWLYSSYGHNFVKTILRLGKERNALNVVYDQIGTPTYAADLAAMLLNNLNVFNKITGTEILHYSNEGVTSWYDFALAITEIKNISCKISPITTPQFPTPAPRPPYSVLAKEKIRQRYGIEIPHWRESLARCLSKI